MTLEEARPVVVRDLVTFATTPQGKFPCGVIISGNSASGSESFTEPPQAWWGEAPDEPAREDARPTNFEIGDDLHGADLRHAAHCAHSRLASH